MIFNRKLNHKIDLKLNFILTSHLLWMIIISERVLICYRKCFENRIIKRFWLRRQKCSVKIKIVPNYFLFLKAPYTFFTLINAVWHDSVNSNLYEVSFWLLWVNSTINPLIYPCLHVDFRKAFLKMFRCLFYFPRITFD